MRRNFYTIQETDVNKRSIKWQGRTWPLGSVMGYVQRGDIGKRIYNMGENVLQVENNEQRDTRLGLHGHPLAKET